MVTLSIMSVSMYRSLDTVQPHSRKIKGNVASVIPQNSRHNVLCRLWLFNLLDLRGMTPCHALVFGFRIRQLCPSFTFCHQIVGRRTGLHWRQTFLKDQSRSYISILQSGVTSLHIYSDIQRHPPSFVMNCERYIHI